MAKLRFFLEQSRNSYAQYLAASGIKQLLTDQWLKVETQEKLQIKNYLLQFLAQKGPEADRQVLKMVIVLLCKVAKMSWFDHPELQGIVQELSPLFQMTNKHFLIGLQTLQDLIIEMSYVHRVKNLTTNRRISLNFRDNALF